MLNSEHLGKVEKKPALLALVEEKWIDQASICFNSGREIVYFCTNSNIKAVSSMGIKNVYFKIKGKKYIGYKADLVGFKDKNPKELRLPGRENETAKYYYGYKNLRILNDIVNLTDLGYFKSGVKLRTDVPGACIISDPQVE